MKTPPLLPGRTRRNSRLNDLLTVIFRWRRLVLFTFASVFIPGAIAILVMPRDYASQTKILVERQRFDPVITSPSGEPGAGSSALISRLDEQDVDSEIDLLQNDDVLRSVAARCGLAKVPHWRTIVHIPPPSREVMIAKAVENLRKNLMIDPPNKSNIVTLRYHAADPHEAASVLQALTAAYFEKHMAVHRAAGSTDFFESEVEQNRRTLQAAEDRLTDFSKTNGVVSAAKEKDALLDKIAEFDAALQTTSAQISASQQRIVNLEGQLKTVTPRVTRQVKTSAVLLEQLKSTLFSLEMKRAELLTKYQPGYRPVQEVEWQIRKTRADIDAARKAPSAESTTDQDPVYLWLTSELAKSRSELAALRASAVRTSETLSDYRKRAVQLQELGNQQDELSRTAKSAEEMYVGSLRKQSEARMSEALDRSRIMNVALAEPATVPALPTNSRAMQLMLFCALSTVVSLGVAFVADYWDPSFRTPDELATHLGVPVLAAIPRALPLAHSDVTLRR